MSPLEKGALTVPVKKKEFIPMALRKRDKFHTSLWLPDAYPR
jgi:hypothetical protein